MCGVTLIYCCDASCQTRRSSFLYHQRYGKEVVVDADVNYGVFLSDEIEAYSTYVISQSHVMPRVTSAYRCDWPVCIPTHEGVVFFFFRASNRREEGRCPLLLVPEGPGFRGFVMFCLCVFQDCLAAVKWAKTNIWAFGGDAARLALVGESSGGTLAIATGLIE